MKKFTAKDIYDWVEEAAEKYKQNPDYSAIWFDLDYDLCIAMGWSGGFDDFPNEYEITYPNDPSYRLMVKICSNTDYLKDYEWMNMPYDDRTGDVWDTELHAPISMSDAEWLLEQYSEIIDAAKYKVTLSFNGVEKTYDTDYLDKDDAEEDALEQAFDDLSIVGYVHEDNDGYYADVVFCGDEKSKETYYDRDYSYEYPEEASREILRDASYDLAVVSAEAEFTW